MLDVGNIIKTFGLEWQLYTSGNQIHSFFMFLFRRYSTMDQSWWLHFDIKSWMANNHLVPNPTKVEFMWHHTNKKTCYQPGCFHSGQYCYCTNNSHSSPKHPSGWDTTLPLPHHSPDSDLILSAPQDRSHSLLHNNDSHNSTEVCFPSISDSHKRGKLFLNYQTCA